MKAIILLAMVFSSVEAKADCSKAYKDRAAKKFLNITVDFTETSGTSTLQQIGNNIAYENMIMREYGGSDEDYLNRFEKLNRALALAAKNQRNEFLNEKILNKITNKVGKDKEAEALKLLGDWYRDGKTFCPKLKDKHGKEYQSVLNRRSIIKLVIKHLKKKS